MAERHDVLVVGAGPAGLAAARAAAAAGARVGLLDAQAHAGGQVWRHDVDHRATGLARRRLAFVQAHPGIDWLASGTVVAAAGGKLLVEDPHAARWLDYGALVLATGAHELLLPFPGWTLPGVTGAGGLQALAKQGWPLAGRLVVVAGSGPLLLAAAASIRRHGGHVAGIHEQAGRDDLRGFVRGLWRWPGKLLQAAALRARLAGVPYHGDSVVVAAHGDDRLREIEVEGPRGRRRLPCDQLAIGYGLVPELRVAGLLGCRLDAAGAHPRVWVDDAQRTSLANVYAAGETCGIGGRDCALAEGAIAGYAAVGRTPPAALRRRRHQARAFAAHLACHFALAERVRRLAQPDTIVCRCEDVSMAALDGHADARAAKLATRSGMGACQGRICGSALAALGRFPSGGHRPPLFPARLDTLGDTDFT